MPRAIWRGTVAAAADRVRDLEDTGCFPWAARWRATSPRHMGAPDPGIEGSGVEVARRRGVRP